MCHGVFDKYPELRVTMIESSWTWVPSTMWRLDHNYRSLRREVPWVKRMPSSYIREQVRFTTQPMEYPNDPEHLYRMFEMIGSDEFLLHRLPALGLRLAPARLPEHLPERPATEDSLRERPQLL